MLKFKFKKIVKGRIQMKKWLAISMVSVMLVGTVAFTALGSGFGMCGVGGGKAGKVQGQGRMMGGQRICAELKLSDAQQQKVLALRQEMEKETLPLRQQMQQKQLELKKLWESEKLDQGAIEKLQKELAGLRVKMVEKMRAFEVKFKAVLTPEQQAQLEKLKADRTANAGKNGRGGKMRGYGQGQGQGRGQGGQAQGCIGCQ